MRRVVIVGNSGSGKTTLADLVAQRLGVAHVELDAHYHQAGWTPTPVQEFAEAVRTALDAADAASGGWVVCGNLRCRLDLDLGPRRHDRVAGPAAPDRHVARA